MKNFKLKNGMHIPAIGLGTWQLTGKTCTQAVVQALEVGYRYIDTAEAYGNQPQIKQGISASGIKREELFITSKVFHDHLQQNSVTEACERTLSELGTEYLDLYLIHWPNVKTPMKDTLSALQTLLKQGKIKAIGVSNFTIRHLKEALDTQIQIVNNQVEFHPSLNQKDLKDFCDTHKILITAYSPIAQGQDLKLPLIKDLSKKYGRSASQVVLNWLISKGMNVIPRAAKANHVEDNFKILEWSLEPDDIAAIDGIGGDNRLVKPWFNEFDI